MNMVRKSWFCLALLTPGFLVGCGFQDTQDGSIDSADTVRLAISADESETNAEWSFKVDPATTDSLLAEYLREDFHTAVHGGDVGQLELSVNGDVQFVGDFHMPTAPSEVWVSAMTDTFTLINNAYGVDARIASSNESRRDLGGGYTQVQQAATCTNSCTEDTNWIWEKNSYTITTTCSDGWSGSFTTTDAWTCCGANGMSASECGAAYFPNESFH